MLKGCRLVIVGLVAALSLAAGEQPTNQPSVVPDASQSQFAKAVQAPYAPYPNLSEEACYKARDHDAADLCAQWRAAIAGEKAAHEARRATSWSIVATILSALAVIGLIVTIWQTWGALDQARRSNLIAQKANARSTRQAIVGAAHTQTALDLAKQNSDAATAQVEVARKSAADAQMMGEAQIRAYMSFTADVPQWADDAAFTFSGTIINSGASPARRVKVLIDWSEQDHRPRAKQSLKMLGDIASGIEPVIVSFKLDFVPNAQHPTSGVSNYFVAVRIVYNDIFGNERMDVFEYCAMSNHQTKSLFLLNMP